MGFHHDETAIHTGRAGEYENVSQKGTPVDADLLLIEDSEDSNTKKYVEVGDLPGVETLDDLSDVDTSGVTDGQVLKYDNGSSTWLPADDETGSGSLPSATTKGDIAVYNGSAWVVVAAGSNDHVLTADSGETAGVKWAAGSGGGGGSSYLDNPAYEPPGSPNSMDDEFTTDTITSGPWVVVGPPTGSWDWEIRNGWMDFMVTGMSNQDGLGLVKADTITVGDHLTLAHRSISNGTFAPMMGPCFANGTTVTDSFAAALHLGDQRIGVEVGTFTAMFNSFPSVNNYRYWGTTIYQRIVYQAANTWRTYWSVDGYRWTRFGVTDASFSMTPTHVGIIISGWGSSTIEAPGAIKFFRKNWNP